MQGQASFAFSTVSSSFTQSAQGYRACTAILSPKISSMMDETAGPGNSKAYYGLLELSLANLCSLLIRSGFVRFCSSSPSPPWWTLDLSSLIAHQSSGETGPTPLRHGQAW